jgi:hypothetical protein
MAQTIKVKRSTETAVPSALANGELAYSSDSNKLFIGRPGGGTGDIDAIGGKYYTGFFSATAAAMSANTASKLVLRDASGNFAAGTITANLTGNASGTALTVTQAAQTAITSLGTLTALQVDNLNINGNTLSSTTGALNLTPVGGSAIVLDGTVNVDAGVITGATSITSTAFVGTLSTAAQANVTSLGTLTALQIDNLNINGNTLSSTTGGISITPKAGETLTLDGTVVVDAGVITGATSITSAAFVGPVTGGITGNVTGNADTATALATARTIGGVSFDGTASIVPATITVADTTDTTSFVGLWESAAGTLGPKTDAAITYNAGTGMLTAVGVTAALTGNATTATTLATARTIQGVSFNGGANITTLTAGTGVAVSGTEVAIGQAVATTSNVQFNNVTVDGTLTSDDITAATMTASGHVIVQGNLTVNGTTTTVNSNTVAIGDAIIELNSDLASNTAPTVNAGFEVNRGNATDVSLLWNETNDNWTVSDGSVTAVVLTASNFNTVYSGIIDGGSF